MTDRYNPSEFTPTMPGLAARLQRCQELARERWFSLLGDDGVYPPVDVAALLWRHLEHEGADDWTFEDGWSDPRETLTTFREYLTSRPEDFSARWTTLGGLYALGEEPVEVDDDDSDDDGYDTERKVFAEEFAA